MHPAYDHKYSKNSFNELSGGCMLFFLLEHTYAIVGPCSYSWHSKCFLLLNNELWHQLYTPNSCLFPIISLVFFLDCHLLVYFVRQILCVQYFLGVFTFAWSVFTSVKWSVFTYFCPSHTPCVRGVFRSVCMVCRGV